uniref:UPAR/Ly6 domain-containing protein n=1 Tax=Jaculus jaculus TaxID=51337 RepID=A0A8C5K591_JACJA
MGKHLLPLLLCLSLMVSFLQALRCIQCPKFNSEGVCLTKQTSCRLKRGEKCVLRVLYIDEKFEFGVQECSDVCYSYFKT